MSAPLEIDAPQDAYEIPPHKLEDDDAVRRSAVSEMLADQRELADMQTHIWDNRNAVRTPHGRPIRKDKMKTSGFDSRLAYKGPYLGYYTQNRKIYKGQTQVVPLSAVPEKALDRKGEEVELRRLVREALELSDSEIVASDPLRCPFCIVFRALSDMDKSAHMATKHPKAFAEFSKGAQAIHDEMEAEAEPEPDPTPRRGPGRPPKTKLTAGA